MLTPETAALAASMFKAEQIKNGLPGVTRNVYNYDGKGEPIGITFPDVGQMYFAMLANKAIDPNTIVRVIANVGGNIVEASKEELTIQTETVEDEETGITVTARTVYAEYGGQKLPIIHNFLDSMTLVLSEPNAYVSRIETETIHPIDQKYLPCGSIRMDAYGNSEMTVNDALLNLALEGGGTTTFASGMEPFWADVLAKQPDYLIFNVGDNLRMPICVFYATEGSVQSGESCISANGLLSLYGTNLMGYFVMAQTKDGKGVKISVKSELVIFPETALAEHGGE